MGGRQSANGRFGARPEGPVSDNILLRQAQHTTASDENLTLDPARAPNDLVGIILLFFTIG